MKTMLVPIDFSDVTPNVIRTAGEWAVAAGYRVHLIHVQPEESELVGYEAGMQLLPPIPLPEPPEGNEFMNKCRDELTRQGIEVTTRIVRGSPVLEILDEAASVKPAVIVMGSHRHGMLHHLLLGSVSGGVLKRATCPLLLVPVPRSEPAGVEQAHGVSAES